MNVIRGSFRLSLVAAIAAALYSIVQTWLTHVDYVSSTTLRNLEMHSTLECGTHRTTEELNSAKNEYGLIDLGKLGCASKRFLASFQELEDTRTGKMKRQHEERLAQFQPPAFMPEFAGGFAAAAFIVINLLGLVFLGIRFVYRWVSRGFKPGK